MEKPPATPWARAPFGYRPRISWAFTCVVEFCSLHGYLITPLRRDCQAREFDYLHECLRSLAAFAMFAIMTPDDVQESAIMPKTAKQALERAIERLGGPRQVAALCDVSEWNVKLWLKRGSLNDVKARNAHRFAQAAGEPLDRFLID